MANTSVFVPDTVNDSELDFGYSAMTKVRGGIVTGLSGDPAQALDQCVGASGMPALGSTVIVNGFLLSLRRIVARPFLTDAARIQLVYDNINGAVPTAYIIHSHSYQQGYQTDLVPGTRIPIRVDDWVDPADSSNRVAGDNVVFTFFRTVRELSVTGIKYGEPSEDYEAAVNFANDADFRGKPRGWWVITAGGSDYSKYQGYASFNLSAVSKNDEDHSEIGTLVHKITGRKVKVTDEALAALLALPYNYGIIGHVNGAIRVGPFKVMNFATLFGFADKPPPLSDIFGL